MGESLSDIEATLLQNLHLNHLRVDLVMSKTVYILFYYFV